MNPPISQHITNKMPSGLIMVDREGRIIAHNPASQRIFEGKLSERLRLRDLVREAQTLDDFGRFIGAHVEGELRRFAQIQTHGEASETQVQAVHFGAAELVEGWGIVIPGEQSGAGCQGMIDAQHSRIELGWPYVAPIPRSQAIGERGAVGQRKKIQRRARPGPGGLARGH